VCSSSCSLRSRCCANCPSPDRREKAPGAGSRDAVPHGRTRMIVFPLIRSVGLKAATAASRVPTWPMFVRSRPSLTRRAISPVGRDRTRRRSRPPGRRPAAPCTSTLWPGWRRPCSNSPCHAVRPEIGRLAPTVKSTSPGSGARLHTSTAAYSARVPRAVYHLTMAETPRRPPPPVPTGRCHSAGHRRGPTGHRVRGGRHSTRSGRLANPTPDTGGNPMVRRPVVPHR
jgi:hypothetical protein